MVSVTDQPFEVFIESAVVMVNQGIFRIGVEIDPLAGSDRRPVDSILPLDIASFEKADVVIRPPAGVFEPLTENQVFSWDTNEVGFVVGGDVD